MVITDFIKKYLFELCLTGLLVKTMVAGATIADSLVLISLVISITYVKHYLVKKDADFTIEQTEKLEQVSKQVQSIMALNSIKRGGILGEKK